MIEPAPLDRWSADLEPMLRRYLSATPVPVADHSALLMGVALALEPHGQVTPAQALAVLVDGLGKWLTAHRRLPASMPPLHRGAMPSTALEPLPLQELWRTRHGLPSSEIGTPSTPNQERP